MALNGSRHWQNTPPRPASFQPVSPSQVVECGGFPRVAKGGFPSICLPRRTFSKVWVALRCPKRGTTGGPWLKRLGLLGPQGRSGSEAAGQCLCESQHFWASTPLRCLSPSKALSKWRRCSPCPSVGLIAILFTLIIIVGASLA